MGRAGTVFASQIADLVTASGWSKLLLTESHSTPVWAAFGVMIAGMALAQRRTATPPPPAKNP